MRTSRLAHLSACCLAMTALSAGAAEGAPPSEHSPVVLSDIVVTSPLRQTAEELVRPVYVLDGTELERRRRGTIGDVLLDQPGISSANFGPGVGRPVIRGLGGPRVLILDNGINTMDTSSISGDHAVTVDPLGAERVEIIKGPATLLYGGGAAGGVVNVVDDRLSERVIPGLRLGGDLSYGSNAAEKNGVLRARYGDGPWKLGADYSRRSSNSFSIPGYAVRLTEDQIAGHDDHGHDHGHDHDHGDDVGPWGRIDNSSVRTERYGLSGAWVGSRGMFGAAFSRFETNYGLPGHAHEHDHDHGHGHGHDHGDEDDHSVRIDLEQTRVDVRGLLHAPFTGFERLELRVGVNDYEHAEIEGGRVETFFDVTEVESRIELEHQPFARWVGVGGLQFTHRDFEAIGLEAFVPPVTSRDIGVFLIEQRPIGEHSVELGVRVDHVRHEADDPGTGIDPQRLESSSFTPVSLSAGVAFTLPDHLHLRFNAQRAQRAPAAEELYAFGAHLATASFERGDLGLREETANNVEVSLARDVGLWTWEVGAYYNRFNDFIYLQEVDEGLNADGSGTPSSDGRADRVNQDGSFNPDGSLLLLDFAQEDAEFFGMEARVGVTVIDTGRMRLDLSGFGDVTRGRLVDGGDLPRMPPVRFGVGADGSIGPYSGGIRYLRARKQRRPGALETFTPGYDLLSADLAYALPLPGRHSASVYLQGRNLLDEKARLSTSFLKDEAPLPGRSIFLGLRFDFEA